MVVIKDLKDLKDDAKLLSDIERQTRKIFNDANKLRKQAALMSVDSSVFTCSHTFRKEYLCTYIRAYESAIEELQFDELKNMVNPSIFKNGVMILSSKCIFFSYHHGGHSPEMS